MLELIDQVTADPDDGDAGHAMAAYIIHGSYTAAVTKKRGRDRDIVQELQEDANWSMWTNTFGRQRGWGRPRSLPHGVGLGTYMLAAVLVLGAVAAGIGLFAFLLNLD